MVDRYFKFDDFDPAWTIHEAFEKSEKRTDRLSPFFRWEAWRGMHEECKTAYDAGDHMQLLYALRDSANFDLPMPDWVAREFISKYDSWLNFRVETLDKAFKIKKVKNLNAARKRRMLLLAVTLRAEKRLVNESYNQEFLDSLGKEFNISGSLARNYLKEGRRRLGFFEPDINGKKKVKTKK